MLGLISFHGGQLGRSRAKQSAPPLLGFCSNSRDRDGTCARGVKDVCPIYGIGRRPGRDGRDVVRRSQTREAVSRFSAWRAPFRTAVAWLGRVNFLPLSPTQSRLTFLRKETRQTRPGRAGILLITSLAPAEWKRSRSIRMMAMPAGVWIDS